MTEGGGLLDGAIQEVRNTWIAVAFAALEEERNVDSGGLRRQTQLCRRSQGCRRLVLSAGMAVAVDIHHVAAARIDYSVVAGD